MPELPEVETITKDLIAAGMVGIRIRSAKVSWSRSIAVPAAGNFIRRIAGETIEKIYRRGKFIVFRLASERSLLVHLRMSGRLIVTPSDEPYEKHQHVILRCQNGRDLRFHDPRKFGRFYLVTDADEIIGSLGPEPLARNFKWFHLKRLITTRKRMIKPLLLDQQVIAGLGNIYVDEALWEARIHPLAPSNVLNDQQVKNLYKAIRLVLRRGLRNRGTALGRGASNFVPVGTVKGKNQHKLKVFRRQGALCPRCKETIIRIVVGQRSTHICPVCQAIQPSGSIAP